MRSLKRLKTDYGKSWRQDLNEFLFDSEQEVVESFALMNILNERGTTRELSFKIKDSTYETTKSKVKVSGFSARTSRGSDRYTGPRGSDIATVIARSTIVSICFELRSS